MNLFSCQDKMDTISFHIPVLGIHLSMYIDFIRFSFKNSHPIIFYCQHPNEPMIGKLYRSKKNDNEIIGFLEKIPNPPVVLKRINKNKYLLSFNKNEETIQHIMWMMKLLFPDRNVSMDVYMYDYKELFRNCSLHLLDLYEMGYMSLVDVEFPVEKSFFYPNQKKVYTGLFLRAVNPFLIYHYDFIELDLSNNIQHEFLKMSFHTMLFDRPFMVKNITFIVMEMVMSIPISERYKSKMINYWKQHHELNINVQNLTVPLQQWKPSVFLKHLSRLLDMFPSYYIDHRFNLEIAM